MEARSVSSPVNNSQNTSVIAAESSSTRYPVENLVFEGGGIKGLAYVGALEVLEEKKLLEKVVHVAGASAGAITALALSLGYSVTELKTLLSQVNFADFMDGYKLKTLNAAHLARTLGVYPGEECHKWLAEKLIQPKLGKPYATFADLHAQVISQTRSGSARYREVHVIGANLSTGMQEIFSYFTTPEMPLVDAIRISISIPLFFEPCIHQRKDGKYVSEKNGRLKKVSASEGEMYVDGGLINNFPIELFDTDHPNLHTLGFRVDSPAEISQWRDAKVISQPVVSYKEYGMSLLNAACAAQNKLQSLNNFRTVYIDVGNIGTTQFSLSAKEQETLLTAGKKATAAYLQQVQDKSWLKKGVLADRYRQLKYERFHIYTKADEIRYLKLNDKAIKIQLVFSGNEMNPDPTALPSTTKTWLKTEARVKRYFSYLSRHPEITDIHISKRLAPAHTYYLTFQLSPWLWQELQRWAQKNSHTITNGLQQNHDVVLLQAGENEVRPLWMQNKHPKQGLIEKLHTAVSIGNLKGICELVDKEGLSVNQTDAKGDSLLHIAATIDNCELTRLLLDKGALLQARNRYDDTALHWAIKHRNHAVIELLISRGIAVDISNKQQHTPWLIAAEMGDVATLRLLAEHGVNRRHTDNYGDNALHKAIKSNNPKAVKFIVKNAPSLLNQANTAQNETPLFSAVSQGKTEIVGYLLNQGANADLQQRSLRGQTLQSVAQAFPDILQLLTTAATADSSHQRMNNRLN